MSEDENKERELNQMEKALKIFGDLKAKEKKENNENRNNRNIKIDDIEDDKLSENEKINNENNKQENEENNNSKENNNNENEENEENNNQENETNKGINKENYNQKKDEEQIDNEVSEKDQQNSIKKNNMKENYTNKEINYNDNIENKNNENISQLSKNNELNKTKSKISKKSNKSNKKEYNYEKEEKSIQESAKSEVEELKRKMDNKILIMKTKKFKSIVDIIKEKEEKNALSNFLKLSYYFKTKHIKNIKKKNQEVIIEEILDVPTEATLVEKLKSCDKQIIPPNPIYYYGGNRLKSFNKDINKEAVKNYKKIIPSVQNMSVKPNKDLTILGTEKKIIGEFKENPAFLDVIIEQKEEKKKSVARKTMGKNINTKYMNENLEKTTTNGKDDCLIF